MSNERPSSFPFRGTAIDFPGGDLDWPSRPENPDLECVLGECEKLRAQLTKLKDWAEKLTQNIVGGGIKSLYIGKDQIHEHHIASESISFGKLKLEPLGSVVVPLGLLDDSVTWDIRQISTSSAATGPGWETQLLVTTFAGPLASRTVALPLKFVPFSAIPEGSFMAPGGHPSSAFSSFLTTSFHPAPIEHGVSTAIRPLVQIEDGVAVGGTPVKRFTVFNIEDDEPNRGPTVGSFSAER